MKQIETSDPKYLELQTLRANQLVKVSALIDLMEEVDKTADVPNFKNDLFHMKELKRSLTHNGKAGIFSVLTLEDMTCLNDKWKEYTDFKGGNKLLNSFGVV